MRAWIGCTLVVLMLTAAFGQQPQAAEKQEKHTWRTIGAVAGTAGGYVLGLGIGLAKYDDAVFSTRKVWTVAIIGAVAGGVGGYFAGRAVDKHNATAWRLDPMDRSLLRAQHAMMGYEKTGGVTQWTVTPQELSSVRGRALPSSQQQVANDDANDDPDQGADAHVFEPF